MFGSVYLPVCLFVCALIVSCSQTHGWTEGVLPYIENLVAYQVASKFVPSSFWHMFILVGESWSVLGFKIGT